MSQREPAALRSLELDATRWKNCIAFKRKQVTQDVYIMTVAFSAGLHGHIYFKTGTGNKSRIISIDDVSSQSSILANKLGVSNKEYKRSLLGFYCFTGCDTVSVLKALKLLQEER